eukprot:293749_1
MSSMNVVDIKMTEKEKKEEAEKQKREEDKLNEVTPEDLLWLELLKTLDKLEKGVDGDLSALGRATRNINKFRKRLPLTTWVRIAHTVIPTNYKQEFVDLLKLFITDLAQEEVQLISNLAAVSLEDAQSKLDSNTGDVFQTLMDLIAEKEKLAKIEIKKKQEQLKKERLEREKKKDTTTVASSKEEGGEDSKMEDKTEDKKAMDVDDTTDDTKEKEEDAADEIKITLMPLRDASNPRKFYPETYVFLQLLIALELYDRGEYSLSVDVLFGLIGFCKESNRRTSDLLSSRLYQFYALCQQRMGKNTFDNAFRLFLFDNYSVACLQQNENAQAILIVLILQCYVSNSLYNLAHKFVEKAEFPSSAESQYFARYHFYRGCIDCVELNYSDSLYHLEQSIRRAPQTGAYGFKIASTRWLIVIQLLMGDIPDRNVFKPRFDGNDRNNPQLNEAFAPFLRITQCVREGDLKRYEGVLNEYRQLFIECGLSKILLRLRHNVIKTGLRKINKSYSAISLQDVANKLALASADNAYFIVAKAIRDGVIQAKIDYRNKYLQSTQSQDIYATTQVYKNYAQRTKFCLQIRNNAVKNLRYPPKDDEDHEKEKKEEDEFVSPEEIAQMIQKHFEEEDDED